MADPVRCDNWDRLLLGMSMFAGEGFEPLEFHPYREPQGPTADERKQAAYDRQVNNVKFHPTMTDEEKQTILSKLERMKNGN